jgi:hypothetical protein
MDPIQIVPQGTITISATGASAATALPIAGGGGVRQLEISNAGTVAVFVETGDSTVAATVATGYPILPGQCKVITIKPTATYVGVISGSGTQTVYVSVGVGE